MDSKFIKAFSWAIAAILILGVVVWAVWSLFIANPTYHAVLLNSGELYFGQINHFPSYGIENVYTLQANPENEEQPFSMQKFSNVFWGPEDFLKLNRENIVWTAELTDESQILQVIQNNPNLAPQQQPAGNAAIPGSDSTGNITQ